MRRGISSSARASHAVDLDDDEPELGERLRIAARRLKIPRPDAAGLRARIDVVDDRVLGRRIQVGWLVQQSVEIRDAIARLHDDRLRWLPSGCQQA
jgi:hypothetical protein